MIQDVGRAIACMEAAGIITTANRAIYTAASAIPAGEIAATHTWLDTYVQNTSL